MTMVLITPLVCCFSPAGLVFFPMVSTLEIRFCITKGDVLNHLSQHLHVVWNFSLFCPGTQYITEDTSEILVPGVGEEGPAVGKHPDETGEQANVAQNLHLF